jgi:hypothetical protein
VLVGYFLQLPAPSQNPFCPHEAAVSSAHSLSGSVPFAIGLHVPMVPGILQALHVPLQVVLQQTPSTQTPLRHKLACCGLHELPFSSRQLPAPLQLCVPTQDGASS